MSIWGIIATAASVVASGVLNYFSAKETNETNKDIHEEDNAFNREERQLAQAYNSPVAMIERGKMAGINRLASLGLPGSQAASAASPIPMQSPQLDIGGLGSQLSQSELNNSSIDKNNAESNLLNEQAQGQATSNSYLAAKEESQILQNLAQVDSIKADEQYKNSLRDYYKGQLEHLKSMSPLQQSGQTAQNKLYNAQVEESVQNAAESRARVEMAKLRYELDSKELKSKLKLNDAMVKQYLELAENLSWKSAKLQFDADMQTRQQNWLELLQEAEVSMKYYSTEAKIALTWMQARLAGVELDKLSNEQESAFNQWLQKNLGMSAPDFMKSAPGVMVTTGLSKYK